MKKHCIVAKKMEISLVMPVKFWHTSLRFWFFLSYLITTVNKSLHLTNSKKNGSSLRFDRCMDVQALWWWYTLGSKKILKSQLKFLCHDDFMEFVLQNSVCQKEGKFREIAEVLWFKCKFIIYLSTLFYSFRYSALSVCALWNTEKKSLCQLLSTYDE